LSLPFHNLDLESPFIHPPHVAANAVFQEVVGCLNSGQCRSVVNPQEVGDVGCHLFVVSIQLVNVVLRDI